MRSLMFVGGGVVAIFLSLGVYRFTKLMLTKAEPAKKVRK